MDTTQRDKLPSSAVTAKTDATARWHNTQPHIWQTSRHPENFFYKNFYFLFSNFFCPIFFFRNSNFSQIYFSLYLKDFFSVQMAETMQNFIFLTKRKANHFFSYLDQLSFFADAFFFLCKLLTFVNFFFFQENHVLREYFQVFCLLLYFIQFVNIFLFK